ncbi:MAG: PadR family transcriptional regulator [Peptococcaceae bacterium]|nr:PadR family transcriptional regulator [Peptococcaceae bacterium]
MNLDKWKSQIVRGTLEYGVLLMLKDDTCYGYEILQRLSRYPIISSTESTVYPLLRRLQKEGLLASSWKESAEGLPPRKYYTLTDEGRAYLAQMDAGWQSLLEAIEALKGESSWTKS